MKQIKLNNKEKAKRLRGLITDGEALGYSPELIFNYKKQLIDTEQEIEADKQRGFK